MLDPIDPSEMIFSGPMSPSARTCVPPQSSMELEPASRTRTTSPYLSPKKEIAPSALASSIDVSKCRQAGLARISALARSSIVPMSTVLSPL